MDEYAEVMNKYTQAEVYNGFARGYTGLSITYGFALRDMLWLEDGVYCFDEEERGEVRRGGDVQFAFDRFDAEGDAELHGVDLATRSWV